MNIKKYDVLNTLVKHGALTQRELAKKSGCSVGKVNSVLKDFITEGYIDDKLNILPKTTDEIKKNRPKHAVILAAGYGMRMVPINVEEPKGLLVVRGERLIERIIRQLHEVGVRDIDVVVGFMKEHYEYLIDEYGVNLVYNALYSEKNNLHSLRCASDKLDNCYIIPCDIWSEDNPFSEEEWYSWYLVTDEITESSSVRVNRQEELVRTKSNEPGNTMIGIAYILSEDACLLQKKIEDYSARKEFDHSFWETALLDTDNIHLGVKVFDRTKVFEINTFEQLREIDNNSQNLNSDVLRLICNELHCEIGEIEGITSLKKGMTNRSFEFVCRNRRYIMRVPGEGTDKLINRAQEYNVYQCLEGSGITEPVKYMSPKTGYKLTEYIDNTRNCNSQNDSDVKKCMEYLRCFHEKKFKVDHFFDLFEQIEYYERLRGIEKSAYKDYQRTKEKMYELKNYIEKQPKQIALTHIDAVCDNFLMTDDRIYLIDWEYAGMQDVHVDIAMFAIYAMYDRDHVEKLIDYYFEKPPEQSVRTKIYCYIAICGFLWSNWCEYKRTCGVEFGEYSLRQYRYAKEYYKIAKEEIEKEKGMRS